MRTPAILAADLEADRLLEEALLHWEVAVLAFLGLLITVRAFVL